MKSIVFWWFYREREEVLPLSDFGLISTLGTSINVNVPNDKIVTRKRNYLWIAFNNHFGNHLG